MSKSHEVSLEAFMLLMSLARLSTVGASCAKVACVPNMARMSVAMAKEDIRRISLLEGSLNIMGDPFFD